MADEHRQCAPSAVLAERIEAVQRRLDSTDNKIDGLAKSLTEGLGKVHGRVDEFLRCALKWLGAFAGSVILTLVGVIGWLLVEGAPWQ